MSTPPMASSVRSSGQPSAQHREHKWGMVIPHAVACGTPVQPKPCRPSAANAHPNTAYAPVTTLAFASHLTHPSLTLASPGAPTCFECVGVLQHNVEGLAGQLSGGAHDEAHGPLAPLQRHAHLQRSGEVGGSGRQ